MTNSKELFHDLLQRLTFSREPGEKQAALHYLLEQRFGITRHQIMMNVAIDIDHSILLLDLDRLNRHEPVQYVVETAWFRQQRYAVNPSVLIPRPETELLVQEVIDRYPAVARVVDVGTGSGCIAISLALEMHTSNVFAVDKSEAALSTAKKNATTLGAKVDFRRIDVLQESIPFNDLDVLVSNPPYVRELEKKEMDLNVLRHEPHDALFVPDHDPLVFYRALAIHGKKVLRQGGALIAEINSALGLETQNLFLAHNYRSVTLKNDLEGKDRIIIAMV